MPTAIDTEKILRLYGDLKERVLAKDAEGTIEIYDELLRLGQPLSEIMAQGARALDSLPTSAPDLAGEASAGGADATVLDEPAPDSARPEPAAELRPEPSPGGIAGNIGEPPDAAIAADALGEAFAVGADATTLDEPAPDSARPERSSGSIAGSVGEPSDGAIAPDAFGEASPIAGDTGDQLPFPGPANVTPGAGPESRPVAMARLSPIARLGLAAGVIAVLAGIGVLLMHPAAQKVAPGDRASEASVSVRAETSSTAEAAARATGAAVSATAIGEASSTEPGPPPAPAAASTGTAPPSAEPALPLPPVPEAPAREAVGAVVAPAPAAAPAEPVPASLPTPASPTPKAPSRVAAPAPQISPNQPRLAGAEIAALLARGDSLLGVGDIASARLFYERASDAGDGRAALRLGATYDPGFLDRVHLPQLQGDVAQALSWYRRARDLGESDAELWIQALETKSGR